MTASPHQQPAAALSSTAATDVFEPLVRQWAIQLTSRRRDGTPVATAVSLAVDGRRAYIRTYDRAWKTKRILRDSIVGIAPSTARGTATGPAIWVRARLIEGDEAGHAARLLARKYPILHGLLVPLAHRVRGYRTVYFELTPLDS